MDGLNEAVREPERTHVKQNKYRWFCIPLSLLDPMIYHGERREDEEWSVAEFAQP